VQGAGKAADASVVYQDVHAARLALDQSGQRFNRGQTGDVALGDFSSPTCLDDCRRRALQGGAPAPAKKCKRPHPGQPAGNRRPNSCACACNNCQLPLQFRFG
jgi:hypothetical protein